MSKVASLALASFIEFKSGLLATWIHISWMAVLKQEII